MARLASASGRRAAAVLLAASWGLLALACGAPGGEITEAPAAPPGPSTSELPAIPAEVDTLLTGGWWIENGTEGTCRVIITNRGYDKIVSSLFVQWIEVAGPDSPPRILETRGFDEVDSVSLYSLEVKTSREGPDGFEVELEGRNAYTNEVQGFLLRIGLPGEATLRPL